ncbi:MAG: hypothetical protein Q9226_006898, partial [Calogaya cf. arnoldii]
MFTLIVGPAGNSFTAHAAYLSQSPVFEKMCNGEFKKGQTSEIELPEDDPEVISALIQYLYSGNFVGFGSLGTGQGPKDVGSQLAALYVTADKYQLQKLKDR